jgi:hypothetical protein
MAGELPKLVRGSSNLVQTVAQRGKELAAVKARLRKREETKPLSGREFGSRKAGVCSAQGRLEEWRAETGTLGRLVEKVVEAWDLGR